jgi:Clp amino terminal domain, pathogenicity island component
MFQRYTENARRAIWFAREEASKAGCPCIESEHLLLGIARSCEPQLDHAFDLQTLQSKLRTQLADTSNRPTDAVLPLSNENNRVLAYAAEEAARLRSAAIDSRHLMLGLMREPDSVAGRFLASSGISLQKARDVIAAFPPATSPPGPLASATWFRSLRARRQIGWAAQIAGFAFLALGVAESNIAGRHLIIVGVAWFVLVFSWLRIGSRSFAWMLGKGSIALALTYAIAMLYQLFLFGWIVPLAIGLYRAAMRR